MDATGGGAGLAGGQRGACGCAGAPGMPGWPGVPGWPCWPGGVRHTGRAGLTRGMRHTGRAGAREHRRGGVDATGGGAGLAGGPRGRLPERAAERHRADPGRRGAAGAPGTGG
ncbi:hypothetical protein GCM10020000_48330 [Streptomyces olivoverticillatus]